MKNILNKSILFLVLFLLLSMLTFAGNFTWTGSTSTAWSTATNWSPAQVPSTNDTVTIVTGSNNTNLTSNTTVKVFTINSGTVDMRGFKLKVSGNANFNSGTITNGQLTLNGTSEVYFSGTLIDAVTKVSDRFIYLNGSTFSDSLTIVKTGDQPDNSKGGNTFNGYVSLVDSFTGAMVLSDSFPDTFNSILSVNNVSTGGIYLAHRGTGNQFNGNVTFLGTKIYSNYYGTATYGGNITISCGSGEVYFGYSTGSCSLVSGKTISLSGPDFSSGNLYFRNFTQLDTTTTISLTLLGTSHLYFESGSAFNAPVTCSAPLLYLDGTKFYRTTSLTNTGSSNVTSTGGCYFGGLTTINNNPASSITYSLANTTTDTFATTATIQNSKGIIDFNNGLFNGNVTLKNLDSSDTNVRFYVSNSGATKFEGTLTIDNHGSNMVFGKSGGTTILDSSQVISFVSGFSGNIQLAYFSQRGSTSQSFTFPGSGSELILGSSSSFDGSVTFYGQSIELDGTTFNGTTSITRYGSSGNTCYGGNVFNGTTTIRDSSSSSNNFIMANSSADDFNGNAAFIQKGTGVNLYPTYTKNSTFAGSITVDGSSAISFGANGGKAIIDGSSSQSINNSGSYAPSFKKIEVNKSGGALTLNTPLSISDSLILLKGIINSDTTNIITLANGGIATNASDSSFVNGPFKKIGNAAFIFPIGYDVSNGFHPLAITAPSSTTDAYTAQYFHSGQTLGSTLDTSIEHLSDCQYWNLTRNTGTSKVRIKLTWNHDNCTDTIIDPKYMRIVGWNGTIWKDFGSYAYSGDSLSGSSTTTDSTTTINSFTLTNKKCIYFKDYLIKRDVICYGKSDGNALAIVSGGTRPYKYSWSNSMGTDSMTPNLMVDTYFVTIRDTLNCYLLDSVVINQPSALSAQTGVTRSSTCGTSDGIAYVTASGGTGVTKKYFWTFDGSNAQSDSNLASGVYTVLVTDSNGCVVFRDIMISDTSGPSISLSSMTSPGCFSNLDGAASINVSGSSPFSYAWSSSDSDTLDNISNVIAGIYTVKVTDSLGCITYDSIEITQPDTFKISLSVINSRCGHNEGAIKCTVQGGTGPYHYSWTDSGMDADSIYNLSTDSGSVTVTDNNGCTISSNFTIINSDGFDLTSSIISTPGCFMDSSGSAVVSASGGSSPYSYQWCPRGGTSDTATNLIQDNYVVRVTDAGGCIKTISLSIDGLEPMQGDILKTYPTSLDTSDGFANVLVYGGKQPYTYLWNSGSTNCKVYNLSLQADTVTVTDDNGCNLILSNSRTTGGQTYHFGPCPYYNTPTCVTYSSNPCPTCVSPVVKYITRDFGADGTDNMSDECSFEDAAAYFSALDPATIKVLYIPAGTYYIGRQDAGIGTYYLEGHDILSFYNIQNFSIIGAVSGKTPISILKLNPCMKYGAFDPTTGLRAIRNMGNGVTPNNLLAFPGNMIEFVYGVNILVKNLELDGNIYNTFIGGPVSTDGLQFPAYCGIFINAATNLNVENVKCHHMGCDGIDIYDDHCLFSWNPGDDPSVGGSVGYLGGPIVMRNIKIINSSFNYNARSNMVWAGGAGVSVSNSSFGYAGVTRYATSPVDGLDIENEPNLSGGFPFPQCYGTFYRCDFTFNKGHSLQAESVSSVSHSFQFKYCTFIGPYIAEIHATKQTTFDNCTFIGETDCHANYPVGSQTTANNNNDQTKYTYCYFNEEGNDPSNHLRYSFQNSPDELVPGYCPAGHQYLLNFPSARTVISHCISHTNFTLIDGYIHGGSQIFNYISLEWLKLYNHGLNYCLCDAHTTHVDLSSIVGINILDYQCGQIVVGSVRGTYPPCTTAAYYTAFSWYWNPAGFTFNDHFPCSLTSFPAYCSLWPTVPKYQFPIDSHPVSLPTCPTCTSMPFYYTTNSGNEYLEDCLDGGRIRSNLPINIVEIKIYPNPATNLLILSKVEPGIMYYIYNSFGQEIISGTVDSESQISLHFLSSGLYFIRFSDDRFGKFIKL